MADEKDSKGQIAEVFFPEVSGKIEYKGPNSDDPLSFKYYNPEEVVLGKKMKEWLRFSVCYWHTFVGGGGQDPFGGLTLNRPWENDDGDSGGDPITIAKRRVDVAFEFFTKLNVEFYTFHDYDLVSEGSTVTVSQQRLDTITDYLLEKQNDTGVKLLWATQNLFSHKRYMNGGMTNPDVTVFCYATAQVQKVMDINHKLGGSSHVFWGGREGYQSLLNTDMKAECDHAAALYKMAVEYKREKNYTAQFLIEPKPREPMKHQYDYDVQTSYAFLKHYGLEDEFQFNVEPNHTTLAGHEPEHDIYVASVLYDKLGSVDSNTGDTLLGWDTDQFPTDLRQTTAIMSIVLRQGGLVCGGLNFDCKVRRESVDPIDLFIGHIGAMDMYALGLRKAVELQEKGVLGQMLKDRYSTWKSDPIGPRIEKGEATMQECTEYIQKKESLKQEIELLSGKQELYEMIRNHAIYK